jgi:tetratricopeptide (TPR) repeat protein
LTARQLALVGCPLLAILIYLPTIGHDFVFDDRGIIELNPLMQDIRDLPRLAVSPYWTLKPGGGSLYRPLTTVSLALDRQIAGGMRAWWFHLVNVLLHGLVTLLLTRLTLELLPGALAASTAGLLFAVHPVHVEAVAGVVGRADLLSAAALLAAVLWHRRALSESGGRFVAPAWAAVFLAIMAKESGVAAAFVCAVADAACPVAGAPARRRTALYAGYGVALAIALLLRLAVLGSIGTGQPIPFIDNPAAAAGFPAGRLTALGAVARYAALLAWPRRLSADYSFDQIPIIRTLLDPLAMAGALIVVLVLGGGMWLVRRSPVLGFALLFAAIAAAPVSNLVFFIGTLLAERLLYLPSVGICLLIGGVAALRRPRLPPWLIPGAVALLALLGGARAALRIPDWKDDLALYRSAVTVSPSSARIRHNLGNAYLRRGALREAEAEFRAALAIYPEFNDSRVNLAAALIRQERAAEAVPLLETAAERSPDSADIAINLGNAYRALGRPAEAEVWYGRALGLDGASAMAWNNLGAIDLARGEIERAVERLRAAVRLEPDSALFHINLADALVAAGREVEAREQFEAAYRIDPELPEAHRGLGEAALMAGDRERAEREFRAALDRDPSLARAANFLGYLLAMKGDAVGAAAAYRRAVEIDPGLYDAHRSLGLIYAERLDDPDRAIFHLERSLALEPAQPEAGRLEDLLDRLRKAD